MNFETNEDDLSRVTKLACALSPDEQVILIYRLEENLKTIKPDPEVEAAWAAEIERRVKQVENGEVELIDGDVVFREARERLAQMRERKASTE